MANERQAMDCGTGPADWAGLGARIVRAAQIATAIHLAERATYINFIGQAGDTDLSRAERSRKRPS
jgi:hypothetical protein